MITRCSRCRAAAPQFAYMQDGRHYCVACARRIRGIIGMRPVGRREGDLRQF
jgi:hypothetical protein